MTSRFAGVVFATFQPPARSLKITQFITVLLGATQHVSCPRCGGWNVATHFDPVCERSSWLRVFHGGFFRFGLDSRADGAAIFFGAFELGKLVKASEFNGFDGRPDDCEEPQEYGRNGQ